MHETASLEHSLYLKKIKQRKILVKISQISLLAAFFGIWEAAAVIKLIDPFIFGQPSQMFKDMIFLAKEFNLLFHIRVTLGECILGFLISTILGTFIAMLLWWNDFLQKTLNPYLVVLNSLPKTALAPILIVWIGNNVRAVIFTAVITSIIVTVLSVLTGFNEVSKDKIKLVRTFGGTKLDVLLKVVFPASIPTIANALDINIGLSFVGVIVGEFLVAKYGLGYLISYGSQILRMSWVMTSIIILCLLAALVHRLAVALMKACLSGR
ncbi:MAG: ABC transporter permease [Clostridiales bacterium]|jgi:NitT/TauT family transport system permease protein|nr:ABC transporter permease [Clostridiales bacterium]